MNRWTLLMVGLMMGMVVSFAMAQEREAPRDKGTRDRQFDDAVRDFDLRERQLQMQKRESEVYFESEMRKMQLEQKKIELEHAKQMGPPPSSCPLGFGDGKRGGPMRGRHPCAMMMNPLFVLVCVAVNILLAIWVAQDIRKRNAGSRLWIAIVLLSGFFGGLLYALVRIGDRQG